MKSPNNESPVRATARLICNGKKQQVTLHFSDGSSEVIMQSGSLARKFVNIEEMFIVKGTFTGTGVDWDSNISNKTYHPTVGTERYSFGFTFNGKDLRSTKHGKAYQTQTVDGKDIVTESYAKTSRQYVIDYSEGGKSHKQYILDSFERFPRVYDTEEKKQSEMDKWLNQVCPAEVERYKETSEANIWPGDKCIAHCYSNTIALPIEFETEKKEETKMETTTAPTTTTKETKMEKTTFAKVEAGQEFNYKKELYIKLDAQLSHLVGNEKKKVGFNSRSVVYVATEEAPTKRTKKSTSPTSDLVEADTSVKSSDPNVKEAVPSTPSKKEFMKSLGINDATATIVKAFVDKREDRTMDAFRVVTLGGGLTSMYFKGDICIAEHSEALGLTIMNNSLDEKVKTNKSVLDRQEALRAYYGL